jgi:hypothetical protein
LISGVGLEFTIGVVVFTLAKRCSKLTPIEATFKDLCGLSVTPASNEGCVPLSLEVLE